MPIRGPDSVPFDSRITAPGSSWPQSTRIVQLKRRQTSKVDSMIVLGARRGRTRRSIPFLHDVPAAPMSAGTEGELPIEMSWFIAATPNVKSF